MGKKDHLASTSAEAAAWLKYSLTPVATSPGATQKHTGHLQMKSVERLFHQQAMAINSSTAMMATPTRNPVKIKKR